MDAGAAIEFEVSVGDAGFGRARRAINDNSSPDGRGSWSACKNDRSIFGSFSEKLAAAGDGQIDAGGKVNRRAGLDGESYTRVNGKICGNVVGAARGCPGGVRGNRASFGGSASIIEPDGEIRARDLFFARIESLNQNAVKAGSQLNIVVGPCPEPCCPACRCAIHEDGTGFNGIPASWTAW